MTDASLLDRLKARGEEVFAQVSAQLMANPQFMKAVESALKGKQVLDQAAGRALKQMNIPTRSEFKKALGRIDALEREVAALKARPAPAPRKPGPRAAKRAPEAGTAG